MFLAGSPNGDLFNLSAVVALIAPVVGSLSTVALVPLAMAAMTNVLPLETTTSPTRNSLLNREPTPVQVMLDAPTANDPVSLMSEFEATTVFPDARFALVGPQIETL